MNRFASILVATALVTAACGSGTTPRSDPGTGDPGEAEAAAPDDVAETEADEDAVEDVAPEIPQDVWNTRYRIVLLADSATLFLLQDETASIRVKIYDRDAGATPAPVANQPVGFAITAVRTLAGADAQGDGALETATVTTGGNGVATGKFLAGKDCVRVYDVTVTAGDAEPLVVRVQVNCANCACVKATAAYEGTLPGSSFAALKASVYPEGASCIDLQAGTISVDAIASQPMTDLATASTFDCVPPGENSMAVVVEATGANGCPIAWGCLELLLKAGKCRDAAIDLYDLFLDPAGTFDWVDRLEVPDLDQDCPGGDTTATTCLSGSAGLGKAMCCVVKETGRLLATSRSAFASYIADAAAKAWGQCPTDAQQPCVLKDAIRQAGQAYDGQPAPAWVAGLGAALRGTVPALKTLEAQWVATVTLATSDSVSVSPAFLRIQVGDPAKCTDGACEPLVLDGATLAGAPTPVTIATSAFDGGLAPGGKLTVPKRSIPLDLGRLYLHLAQDRVIAPATGNAVRTPTDAVKAWFDCAWLVPQVMAQLPADSGLTQDQVAGYCSSAYAQLLAGLTGSLEVLSQSSALSMYGSAMLDDGNCDRKVEAVRDGQQDGTVQSSLGQGAVVHGSFTATAQ